MQQVYFTIEIVIGTPFAILNKHKEFNSKHKTRTQDVLRCNSLVQACEEIKQLPASSLMPTDYKDASISVYRHSKTYVNGLNKKPQYIDELMLAIPLSKLF